jgi:metal-responsive CopG/Arc/MetJ family transcriptional regulator
MSDKALKVTPIKIPSCLKDKIDNLATKGKITRNQWINKALINTAFKHDIEGRNNVRRLYIPKPTKTIKDGK